ASLGSIAPGVSQTFTIVATVNCNAPAGSISNVASALYSSGQIHGLSKNSLPATINVTNSGAVRVSSPPGSPPTLNFGTTSVGASSVPQVFTVDNTIPSGCPSSSTISSLLRT